MFITVLIYLRSIFNFAQSYGDTRKYAWTKQRRALRCSVNSFHSLNVRIILSENIRLCSSTERNLLSNVSTDRDETNERTVNNDAF